MKKVKIIKSSKEWKLSLGKAPSEYFHLSKMKKGNKMEIGVKKTVRLS